MAESRTTLSPMGYLQEFHRRFNLDRSDTPVLPPAEVAALRLALIRDEVDQLAGAVASGVLARIAHELADVVYVAYGTAVTYGIPLDDVLAELHRANMTRGNKDGTSVFRPDGKLLRGDQYEPPDIAGVLQRHETAAPASMTTTVPTPPADAAEQFCATQWIAVVDCPDDERGEHLCNELLDHRDVHICVCGQHTPQCGSEYQPERRDRSSRIVRCSLAQGHGGDHKELFTIATWPPDPAASVRPGLYPDRVAEQWRAAYHDAANRVAALGFVKAESALRGVVNGIDTGSLTPWADRPPVAAEATAPVAQGSPVILGRAPDDEIADVIEARLSDAWPHLDDDPVFLRQVAIQAAMAVRDGGRLLTVEARRVLEAVGPAVHRWRHGMPDLYDERPEQPGDVEEALAAAWDAMVGDRPAEPCGDCDGTGRVEDAATWGDSTKPCRTCAPVTADLTGPTASERDQALHNAQQEDAEVDALLGTEEAFLAAIPAVPEPDSVPGWDRERIEYLASGLDISTFERDPAGMREIQVVVRGDTADQLRALLADRDRHASILAEIGDDLSPTGERPEEALGTLAADVRTVLSERNAARAELAEVTADRNQWRAAAERYSSQREEARAEVKAKELRMADILRRLEDARHEAASFEAMLATARRDNDQLREHGVLKGQALDAALADVERLTGELATARRDAAAGGAALVASQLIPAGTAARDDAQDLIDDLRTGARTIPVSEPAEDGETTSAGEEGI